MEDAATIRRALTESQTIVVVGMTDDLRKAGGYVPEYLIGAGYDVIAVHPTKRDVQGRPTYPTLDAVPDACRPDLIDVFRPSAEMPALAAQARRLAPRYFWMQLGLRNAEARRLLEAQGINAIEDRCTMAEHAALVRRGEIRP